MLSQPKCIEENVILAPFTYFRIGGPARYFARITTEARLEEAVAFAQQQKLRFVTLSGGSNVLVSDEGFDGLVLHIELRDVDVQKNIIRAGAGVPMARLVQLSVTHALDGMAWAIGVPGMVGGSVRGNAGCFGGEVRDVLSSVRALNTVTHEWEELENDACEFGYRDSMFKRHPEYVITTAEFTLRLGDSDVISNDVREHTRARVTKQDIGEKCAGCMFKNPKGEVAGELIERAGLKGFVIGGAQISTKHGNFIVSDGTARAIDVQNVVQHVKEKVKREFNVTLEEEIQFIS